MYEQRTEKGDVASSISCVSVSYTHLNTQGIPYSKTENNLQDINKCLEHKLNKIRDVGLRVVEIRSKIKYHAM